MLSGACFDSYNHVGNQARLACDCKVVFINSRDEILLIAKREINYLPLLLIIGVDTISLKENVCLESR